MGPAEHSMKPHSNGSLLPLVLQLMNTRIDGLARDIQELKTTTRSPTSTNPTGMSWREILDLALKAWRVFGPMASSHLAPIVIAALVWVGATAHAMWKWLLPFILRLFGS